MFGQRRRAVCGCCCLRSCAFPFRARSLEQRLRQAPCSSARRLGARSSGWRLLPRGSWLCRDSPGPCPILPQPGLCPVPEAAVAAWRRRCWRLLHVVALLVRCFCQSGRLAAPSVITGVTGAVRRPLSLLLALPRAPLCFACSFQRGLPRAVRTGSRLTVPPPFRSAPPGLAPRVPCGAPGCLAGCWAGALVLLCCLIWHCLSAEPTPSPQVAPGSCRTSARRWCRLSTH